MPHEGMLGCQLRGVLVSHVFIAPSPHAQITRLPCSGAKLPIGFIYHGECVLGYELIKLHFSKMDVFQSATLFQVFDRFLSNFNRLDSRLEIINTELLPYINFKVYV